MEEQKINQKIKTAYEHAAPEDARTAVSAAAAEGTKRRNKKRARLRFILSAAAVLAVVAGVGIYQMYGKQILFSLNMAGVNLSDYVLAAAEYPETSDEYSVTGNELEEDKAQRLANQENYPEYYDEFALSTLRMILASGEDTENIAYSPISLYMTLAMLAETTDGDSRAQILEALGAEDTKDTGTLRTQAQALWMGNYISTRKTTSILASSIWLNEDLDFIQSTLDTLASGYCTSTYRGDLASSDCQNAILKWLNENTGNMLADLDDSAASQRKKLEMDADTAAALFSTIYFDVEWSKKFEEEDTEEGEFQTADGTVTCDFMNQTIKNQDYWKAEQFSAIFKGFSGTGGGMWLILPDEGVSVYDLLEDEVLAAMLTDGYTWSNGHGSIDWKLQLDLELEADQMIVNLSMPKFDISSELDLTDTLTALGVTDVFDERLADFSALTGAAAGSDDSAYLSRVQQTIRVEVNEEGVRAAAYTEADLTSLGSAPSQTDEIDFVLDRPFLFVAVSDTGTMLFAGVVNQPQ
ncbi:MAG: hypothetical protein LUE29_13095 [Lachnospiraceae bacterium]|nr:hypothetical protein [Lachnospiraceae bacterium]